MRAEHRASVGQIWPAGRTFPTTALEQGRTFPATFLEQGTNEVWQLF